MLTDFCDHSRFSFSTTAFSPHFPLKAGSQQKPAPTLKQSLSPPGKTTHYYYLYYTTLILNRIHVGSTNSDCAWSLQTKNEALMRNAESGNCCTEGGSMNVILWNRRGCLCASDAVNRQKNLLTYFHMMKLQSCCWVKRCNLSHTQDAHAKIHHASSLKVKTRTQIIVSCLTYPDSIFVHHWHMALMFSKAAC